MRISAIKQQTKRPDRYSIFVDGAYSFSLSESALLETGIASGQELDATALQEYARLSRDDKAYQMTLRYAAGRMHSVKELKDYLARKEVAPDSADTIISRLARIGLADDDAFARSWVENRRRLKPISLRRLRMELRSKGIDAAQIDSAIGDSDFDEQTALRTLVAKKYALVRYRQHPDKLVALLARQGFGYDEIKSAMNESVSDDSSGRP